MLRYRQRGFAPFPLSAEWGGEAYSGTMVAWLKALALPDMGAVICALVGALVIFLVGTPTITPTAGSLEACKWQTLDKIFQKYEAGSSRKYLAAYSSNTNNNNIYNNNNNSNNKNNNIDNSTNIRIINNLITRRRRRRIQQKKKKNNKKKEQKKKKKLEKKTE